MNSQKKFLTTRALVMLSFTLTSARVYSQNVPVKTLSKPSQTFAEPFSDVADVREQSDGRVVVLDKQETKILRINFNTGKSTQLGRSGQGPGEYTLPLTLVAFPGDTTLAPDMIGGGHALVITRDAVAGTPFHAKGFVNKPLFNNERIQADSKGRIYERVDRFRTANGKLMRTDSVGVRRLDRSTGEQDTIGMLYQGARSPLLHTKPTSGAVATTREAPIGAARGAPPPFMSFDQWAVAPDGRIAMISVEPYQVTLYGEDGKRTIAPPIAYTPIPMSAKLKAAWREHETHQIPSLTWGADKKMAAGHTTVKYVEPDEWPAVLPPFLPDAVRFAPDGNLWIERVVAAGASQTFDVIDRTGRVASRVVMPPKSRLVGLGNRTVYLVRIDNDDLEHLERHVLSN